MAKRNPESLMNESGKFGKKKKIDRMDGKKNRDSQKTQSSKFGKEKKIDVLGCTFLNNSDEMNGKKKPREFKEREW